jgi:hypothetical protein
VHLPRRGVGSSSRELVGKIIVLDVVAEIIDATTRSLIAFTHAERDEQAPEWCDEAVRAATKEWVIQLARDVCDENCVEKVFRRLVHELAPLLGLEHFSWMEGEEQYEAFALISQRQYAGVSAFEALEEFAVALAVLASRGGENEQGVAEQERRRRKEVPVWTLAGEIRSALVAGPILWNFLDCRSQLSGLPSRHTMLGTLRRNGLTTVSDLSKQLGCEVWWVRSWALAEPQALYGHSKGHVSVAYLPDILPTWPDIDAASVAELRRWAHESRFSVRDYRIDKLMAESELEFQPRIQNIRSLLHSRIVKALTDRGRSMTNGELSDVLGERVRIDPLTLPPGRILAYGRHEKFMHPDGAVFVLREWIQTPTQRKGKISPDRLLSALVEKDWRYDDQILAQCLSRHELYIYIGVVFSSRLALEIANSLRDKPTDPYHLGLIRKKLEGTLLARAIRLDSGFFVFGVAESETDEDLEADLTAIVAQVGNRLRKIESDQVLERVRAEIGRCRALRELSL